jgi:Domain of unknown function (DUF4326)
LIKVHNIHDAPIGAKYIGRATTCYDKSVFHNPYRRGSFPSREDCLIQFAIYWFSPEQKILRDEALGLLNDIMCWCHETDWCHGHIIAGYVEWKYRQIELAMQDVLNWSDKWIEKDIS